MAEDLTDYLQQAGVRVRYLHSDIDAIERMEILRGLRLGDFDVLVGINLLREGLDLPEVSLVAILDADHEGFLRSDRSLIQTVGRAARHSGGHAILYADRITGSMQRALDEMDRRRTIQQALQRRARHHPDQHRQVAGGGPAQHPRGRCPDREARRPDARSWSQPDLHDPVRRAAAIAALERQMRDAAANLEYEVAALLRDQILELRALGTPGAVRAESRPRQRPARRRV